jgi:predicted AlkP superfamily pyrophosphatase or phosphodiesterase
MTGSRGRRAGWALAQFILSIATAIAWGGDLGGQRASRQAEPAVDAVVLISIDGMRWDYPVRTKAPAFARMAREGVSATGLVPPFPASTFPAHATLATGVYPDRHGILNNAFLDSDRGPFRKSGDASWLMAEPIWVTAERQGMPAAVDQWVFSSTPWRGTIASFRRPFSPTVKDSERIDQALEWLGRVDAERPRLILSYLNGVDAVGHREGPDADEVSDRVLALDRQVERLLRWMSTEQRRMALIVVSDHGMSAGTRARPIDQFLEGEASGVRAFYSGGTANLYCPDSTSCAAAAAALERSAGMEILRRDLLPADLHYLFPSRTGDLVAVAPPGEHFTAGRASRWRLLGKHGYRPETKDMWGIFYAWGAGLQRGVEVHKMRSVDVAPLICRLLGIDPPPGIEGNPPALLWEENGTKPEGNEDSSSRRTGPRRTRPM